VPITLAPSAHSLLRKRIGPLRTQSEICLNGSDVAIRFGITKATGVALLRARLVFPVGRPWVRSVAAVLTPATASGVAETSAAVVEDIGRGQSGGEEQYFLGGRYRRGRYGYRHDRPTLLIGCERGIAAG
jgi:hypothetical protein